MAKKRWFPLESNPSLLNSYISNLGFDTSFYQFVDIFSTEEWALEMIPPGCVATIMLYPISPVQEEHRKKENEEIVANTGGSGANINDDVWFIKQRIGNACGTIGILHALANIPEPIRVAAIGNGSWLDTFYNELCPVGMDPLSKAEILESNDEIESKHDAATSDSANQTSRGSIEDKVLTHFVSIVNVNGGLFELDGRKESPIRHGDTSQETFLKDSMGVVKAFMDRDPNEMRFTMLALVPT